MLKTKFLAQYTSAMKSAGRIKSVYISQLKVTLAEQLLDSIKSKIKFVC